VENTKGSNKTLRDSWCGSTAWQSTSNI